mmetsp:Transcript_7547/g.10726  ORF Transcript_7547/g.10726 Transcript_7547/m.10726 type:complete len:201 (-) Transcript_7547:2059-2661(-)
MEGTLQTVEESSTTPPYFSCSNLRALEPFCSLKFSPEMKMARGCKGVVVVVGRGGVPCAGVAIDAPVDLLLRCRPVTAFFLVLSLLRRVPFAITRGLEILFLPLDDLMVPLATTRRGLSKGELVAGLGDTDTLLSGDIESTEVATVGGVAFTSSFEISFIGVHATISLSLTGEGVEASTSTPSAATGDSTVEGDSIVFSE